MSDEARLTKIEERYAHLQRHQIEQDKVMLQLGDELARLKEELRQLRARSGGGAVSGEEPLPEIERPPHY